MPGNDSSRKWAIGLTCSFAFAVLMGAGPGLLLVNPKPDSPQEAYFFLGMPVLYVWAVFWFFVQAASPDPGLSQTLESMSWIPLVVLIVYMFVLAGLGVLGYLRSKNTEEDFYLAGRGQGILTTVFTIMATMFSSAAILGIPGAVYKEGAAFLIFAMNLPVAGAAIYLFGSRFRRIGKKRGYVTPGDMIADYYGDTPLVRILVAITGAFYVLIYVIMQIKAGGLLAQTMFPDATNAFFYGMTVLSVVTVFYVLVGGMRSVAWTDILQGSLLLFGMLVAGIATLVAMGGISGFWSQVRGLPEEALRLPGATGAFPWSKLLTIVMYASVASIIQPSQWMRLFAAKDSKTLKRSSIIFAIVLPSCFLFGAMLVALGGRALFPPTVEGGFLAHPDVVSPDQIVPVMINSQLPELMGVFGVILVSVIFVAVLAGSMSTADSNLHAFSAVFMRDIYERFFRPDSSEKERAWVGKGTIVLVMLAAVMLVHFGDKNENFAPLKAIAALMFAAIAFSCQLLPIVIDMVWIRKGTPVGAMAGLATGILVVVIFMSGTLTDPAEGSLGGAVKGVTGKLQSMLDVGFCGFVANALVFAVVSRFSKPLPEEHLKVMAKDMDTE